MGESRPCRQSRCPCSPHPRLQGSPGSGPGRGAQRKEKQPKTVEPGETRQTNGNVNVAALAHIDEVTKGCRHALAHLILRIGPDGEGEPLEAPAVMHLEQLGDQVREDVVAKSAAKYPTRVLPPGSRGLQKPRTDEAGNISGANVTAGEPMATAAPPLHAGSSTTAVSREGGVTPPCLAESGQRTQGPPALPGSAPTGSGRFHGWYRPAHTAATAPALEKNG